MDSTNVMEIPDYLSDADLFESLKELLSSAKSEGLVVTLGGICFVKGMQIVKNQEALDLLRNKEKIYLFMPSNGSPRGNEQELLLARFEKVVQVENVFDTGDIGGSTVVLSIPEGCDQMIIALNYD